MFSHTTCTLAVLLFLASLVLVACSANDRGTADAATASATARAPSDASAELPGDAPAQAPARGQEVPAPAAEAASKPKEAPEPVRVSFQTSMGTIVLELDEERAPVTTANFLGYVERGFYDGTIFHRIVPNFVIQGGGHLPDMTQKETAPPVVNEWRNGLRNVRGSISMARLGNQPDSATSQFFINLVDNQVLDQPRDGAAYAVFGKVVEGMEVVDAIAAVRTTTVAGHQGVPAQPVLIERAFRSDD